MSLERLNFQDLGSAFPKEEPKEKSKKGKSIHFQDPGAKTLERSTPSYFRDMFAIRNSSAQEDKSPRPLKRGQNEWITLEDVKCECKQLDDFLMALLYYVSFFLEKLALEKKPRSFMGKPSALEKKEMQENQMRLAVTKKHLAEMYCILILGLGMADQHHMACGKKKISTARKDREFFECLYNFAAYVAFVTFKQKNLREIQQELGRLLRTNVFNPALRDRSTPTPSEDRKTDVNKEVKKVTFRYRKSTGVKQPAIRSVMDQRSPVLRTLLPMAKDSAQYLFQNHYLCPRRTSPTFNMEDLPHLSSVVTEYKIGIIGAPRSKFNPHTLMPLGTLDEEEEEKESVQTRTSGTSICSLRGSASHPCDMLSRATTEGDYSESNE
ncbi:hypothetical protein lerEdw1_001668 [Lerista edwardsae]|nr:hypothetical protein lerEdw1_001668 [Lerista edwardsae]